MAVRIVMMICTICFQVSFFITSYLLLTSYLLVCISAAVTAVVAATTGFTACAATR